MSDIVTSITNYPLHSLLINWRGQDSNLRRLSRQIYSLVPLTAREPLRKIKPPIFVNLGANVNSHEQ